MLYHLIAVAAVALGLQPPPPAPPAPPAPPVAEKQPDAPAPAAAPERWKGDIDLPNGMALRFIMVLQREGEKVRATMSIPMQGLKDGDLRDVEITKEAMAFTLGLPSMPEASWAHFKIQVEADGQSAKGSMTQGGMVMPVTMQRLAAEDTGETMRPQDPRPPYPYTATDVTFTNAADGAVLAGTLTIPPGAGPHPAVVLITGSGAQNRDEALLGHRPFLVLADYLTRRGIAVLRYDDRGVGGSTSPAGGKETTLDFAGDALAGIEFLKTRSEIDGKRLGLIGHSEGGVAAPIAAAKSTDVAFVVLLAGTGVPGREVLKTQLEAILKAAGVAEESIRKQSESQAELFKYLEEKAPPERLREAIAKMAREQATAAGQPMDLAQLEALVDSQLAMLDSAWFRTFISLDPRESLRKVRCPVLVLNGDLDKQVVATQNVPEIEKALKEGGNTDVTVKVLPKLNHLFQTAETGSPEEYLTIEETFAPAALESIAAWLTEKAGVSPAKPAGEAKP